MISRILTKSIECKEGLMTISGLKNSIRKVKDESAPKTTLFSI